MIEFATITDIGDKEKNEDAIRSFVNPEQMTHGFVLADGLGGHGNGDVASNFVSDLVCSAGQIAGHIDEKLICDCFENTQRLLMSEKEVTGMPSIKTTLVILFMTEKAAYWGHVGDSRLYHFRDGKLKTRTIDHSVVQMLAISGRIKESEIRHHPNRSILLRAMGDEWDIPAYETGKCEKIRKGDAFLLCSDGFWEWIEEKAMSKFLRKDLSAYDTLDLMMKEVKSNGKDEEMDNISAILVKIK